MEICKGNLCDLALKLDYNGYYSSRNIDKQNKFNNDDDDGQDGANDEDGNYIYYSENQLEDNIKQSYNEMIQDANRVFSNQNYTPIDYEAEYEAKKNNFN